MNKKEVIANAALRLGIKELNPMQKAVLSDTHSRLIIIAPTGSGKTLAFAARTLTALPEPEPAVQALIIAPSRELVMQICDVTRRIAIGYKTTALYGGHAMDDEKNSLNPIPQIIVATPGRLLDHLQRGTLTINSPRVLVLDEYDKSLELGFEREMKKIISRIGKPHSIFLTSATEPDKIPDFLGIGTPAYIRHDNSDTPQDRTETIMVPSHIPDKLDTLVNLLHTLPCGSRTIVFANHRESARRIYERLKSDKIDAGLYHGELDQLQRATAIQLFENGTYPILVSTDLGARGIDITGITDVIHYHMPSSLQAWTHRNGRTARIDAHGTVYVITSHTDTVPEYMTFSRTYDPPVATQSPMRSPTATLHFAAGKKEKISRGDIVGFILANTTLSPADIGKITVNDHHTLVAVPRAVVYELLPLLNRLKIKGKKVRITAIG